MEPLAFGLGRSRVTFPPAKLHHLMGGTPLYRLTTFFERRLRPFQSILVVEQLMKTILVVQRIPVGSPALHIRIRTT